ncbi:MAG: hypothetical protein GEU79_02500 [Acidimicrobiia bacterium]|nr:hypothetical protein [Acidimicrobiia bacterium]
MHHVPNMTWFETVVDDAVDNLPDWVVERIDNLLILVEEEPPAEIEAEHGDLLGIYDGVNLLERSEEYWGALPDQITIFRGPHVRMGLSETELRSEVRKTLLHELAHHIGIEDDRLTEIGWD